jgi:hypothetical protein
VKRFDSAPPLVIVTVPGNASVPGFERFRREVASELVRILPSVLSESIYLVVKGGDTRGLEVRSQHGLGWSARIAIDEALEEVTRYVSEDDYMERLVNVGYGGPSRDPKPVPTARRESGFTSYRAVMT